MSDYNHNGIKLTITDDADFSNRLLPGGYTNYHDASDGDKYDFEMQACAVDQDGNKYLVFWIYSNTKGETANELDFYDYSQDEIDRVEAL